VIVLERGKNRRARVSSYATIRKEEVNEPARDRVRSRPVSSQLDGERTKSLPSLVELHAVGVVGIRDKVEVARAEDGRLSTAREKVSERSLYTCRGERRGARSRSDRKDRQDLERKKVSVGRELGE